MNTSISISLCSHSISSQAATPGNTLLSLSSAFSTNSTLPKSFIVSPPTTLETTEPSLGPWKICYSIVVFTGIGETLYPLYRPYHQHRRRPLLQDLVDDEGMTFLATLTKIRQIAKAIRKSTLLWEAFCKCCKDYLEADDHPSRRRSTMEFEIRHAPTSRLSPQSRPPPR